jgi:hypothetical protein
MENMADQELTETAQETYLPLLVGHDNVEPLPIVGLGVLGDSNSDEYRADDNRGGSYAATTLTWIEILASNRKINFGPWGTRDEPRRTGFEYNWARSAANIRGALKSGQHTGLAQQVAAGEVSHVFIFLGGNDFNLSNRTYDEIYNGDLDDVALQAKIDRIVNDLTIIIDTILNAGEIQMVVVPITDPIIGGGASSLSQYPDPSRRQRVTDAINAINVRLEEMAASRPIGLVDLTEAYEELSSLIDDQGVINLAGESINIDSRGNEPHNLRLNDGSGHPGTVASGLFANIFFIKPFNEFLGLEIPLLSDEEILETAGIR